MYRASYFSFLSILLSFSLFGAGCAPFQSQEKLATQVGTDAVNTAVKGIAEGKIQISPDQQGVTFQDASSGNVMMYGEHLVLPEAFPKSMPTYPGARIVAVTISKIGTQGASVTLKSDDESPKVVDWYVGKLKEFSWKLEKAYMSGKVSMRTYVDGDLRLTLTVGPDPVQKTFVTLVREMKK